MANVQCGKAGEDGHSGDTIAHLGAERTIIEIARRARLPLRRRRRSPFDFCRARRFLTVSSNKSNRAPLPTRSFIWPDCSWKNRSVTRFGWPPNLTRPLYQLGENGAISVNRHFLEENAFRLAQQDFYKFDITEGEPIKGNFSSIARDRLSGTLLGPTNYHTHHPRLRTLYEQRFSRRMKLCRLPEAD